ncbi:hypothetical protein A0H81_03665 [Grifola frondosa]|uniref:Uncharacterized protein n=1 Tax=Grifola frondosa TaxID=5627 RepID=A0A1C7MHR7_GRIFR|nr:hypothetical protein A0H81_03665 [Grifola frondosa]
MTLLTNILCLIFRPDRDWGLRNARKTAFHAAVNYYCRQLGIVAYQSPLPITYVGQEMMEVPAPTPVDEEMEPSMEPEREQGRPVTLGFRPPADKLSRNVRVRKARSKKAMLRTMGADGGDG